MPAHPWSALGVLQELTCRVALLFSAPIALYIVDWRAGAFRGPEDGRAEQCAVFWAVAVGLWSILRLRERDLPTYVGWTVTVATWAALYDDLLRSRGSALPPPQVLFAMLLALAAAGLHARWRGRPVRSRGWYRGGDL